jgi:hypothetical protein
MSEEETIAEDNVLRDTIGDVGAKACDVHAIDDARKMMLAEQNSFMVSMLKKRQIEWRRVERSLWLQA